MAENNNLVIANRYEVLRELGEGGFSTVYKVRDLQYGHIRALRTLNRFIINKEDKVCKNWIRECGILMRLGNGNHPNIVHYYRPDIVDGVAFVEMDYVEGQDIREYVNQQEGFVPLDEVLSMVEHISSALAFCHHDIYRYCLNRQEDNIKSDPNDAQKLLIDEAKERELIEKYKVIHNDIHEGNVMRQFDGRYILIDFGLAIQGEKVIKSSRHENGRPEYMAPEKSMNDTVLTEQSDIYSFGILMYQFLAGRVPFEFNSKTSLEKAIVELQDHHSKKKPESILPLRRDAFFRKYPGQEYSEEYPGWLEKIIMKCLEKKPGDRYQNGKELHDAFIKGLNQSDSSKKLNELKALLRQKDAQIKELKREQESMTASNNSLNTEELLKKGEDFLHGQNGVAQSFPDAVDCFRKAAEKGNACAQNRLGYCYRHGYGVKHDWQKAIEWYRRAADAGNASAQNNLGYCYEYGRGVSTNKDEARRLYELASAQGNNSATKALERLNASMDAEELYEKGVDCYYGRKGVTISYENAAKWFQQSAEKGYAEAQYKLGFCNKHGMGVPKNKREAIRLFKLAAAQGHQDAKKTLKKRRTIRLLIFLSSVLLVVSVGAVLSLSLSLENSYLEAEGVDTICGYDKEEYTEFIDTTVAEADFEPYYEDYE